MKFKYWMNKNLDRDELYNIINHGCSSGISGLTYYNEVHKLYEQYESDLWDIMEEIASELGQKGVIGFIALCKPDIGCQIHLENFIVWAAAEHLAQSVLDDMPKRWALTHTGSRHVDYFDSEEEAESERLKCYESEEPEDRGTYEEYCEYWIVEEERD